MRKRKVKSMLATLVAVLVLSGVFMASAAEGTGTGTTGAADPNTTGSTTVTPSEPEKPTEPEKPADVTITNDSKPSDIANSITNTAGDTVKIEFTGEKTELPKEAFAAAKDANKDLVLNTGLVTWTFKKGDIKDTSKNVDLKVEKKAVTGLPTETQNLVKDAKAAVLEFANNGTLPGKATISVAKDQLFSSSTKSTFYMYYLNETMKKLELVATSSVKDGNLNFTIDHNSRYVITDTRLTTATTTTRPSGAADGKKIDEHIVGGSSSSAKDNPHTGAY